MSEQQWYVLRVPARSEHQVATSLLKERIENYLPTLSVTSTGYARKEIPLFPGYLFVKCDKDSDLCSDFRLIHKVVGWVKLGDFIPVIPEGEMSQLRQRVDELRASKMLGQSFKQGQTVRIGSGPFEGLAQVIDDVKSPSARVRLLVKFMGRLVQMQMSADELTDCSVQAMDPWLEREDDVVRLPRRTRGRGRWIQGYKRSLSGAD